MTLDEARKQFEVNVFGLAAITKEVLPYMRKQKSGRIINVSSMGGRVTTYFGAWYHATKYAVEAFSDALRMEAVEFGIKVSLIEPGSIKTVYTLPVSWLSGRMIHSCIYHPEVKLKDMIR